MRRLISHRQPFKGPSRRGGAPTKSARSLCKRVWEPRPRGDSAKQVWEPRPRGDAAKELGWEPRLIDDPSRRGGAPTKSARSLCKRGGSRALAAMRQSRCGSRALAAMRRLISHRQPFKGPSCRGRHSHKPDHRKIFFSQRLKFAAAAPNPVTQRGVWAEPTLLSGFSPGTPSAFLERTCHE